MEQTRINVTRSSMPSYEEYCAEIKELWESRWLTNMGAKHKQFETALKAYLDTPHITLYTNGHLALEGALSAMNFPAGGEVITTPFTFASTTHAIARTGLVPVFCDIEPVHYTMDVTKIESLITEKTCAIVPVHVYGNLCDVEAIEAIARRHGLKVIYDAAHAFGVTYQGVSSANFGDASMYSFHATKVFNTIEGGAVTYRDEALGPVLDDKKNFGLHTPEDGRYIGTNAKMNEFQAAMGLCNLRHLDEEIEKRGRAVQRYRERLGAVKGITLCPEQPHVKPNYAYFPVLFDGQTYTRDAVFEALQAHGIVARKYFYPLINGLDCYKEYEAAGTEKTPVAQRVAANILTLPLFADLNVDMVDRICDIILD